MGAAGGAYDTPMSAPPGAGIGAGNGGGVRGQRRELRALSQTRRRLDMEHGGSPKAARPGAYVQPRPIVGGAMDLATACNEILQTKAAVAALHSYDSRATSLRQPLRCSASKRRKPFCSAHLVRCDRGRLVRCKG